VVLGELEDAAGFAALGCGVGWGPLLSRVFFWPAAFVPVSPLGVDAPDGAGPSGFFGLSSAMELPFRLIA
jgi:hypothetical protein